MTNYPIPTHTRIRNVSLRMASQNAISQSPFTFKQQVLQHPGRRWELDVGLPPMRHSDARQWLAWLAKLDGSLNTFTMSDPMGCVPRGTAISGRTNLLTFSEQFDNAPPSGPWVKTGSTIAADAVVAPDGETTAELLTEDTSDGLHSVRQTITATPLTEYTVSVYAKAVAGGRPAMRLRMYSEVGFINNAKVDLTLGTISAGDATRSISEDLGDGWYRVRCTGTMPSGATSLTVSIEALQTISGSQEYLGDGTDGPAIWGAQINSGTLADYQPIAGGYGPFVAGAGQTGASLNIDGASPSETGYLKAGDYIQLGSGEAARLHMVTDDVDTDAAGAGTLSLWPAIVTAPADDATVIVSNAVGAFRLASNVSTWSVDEAAIYGISFSGVGVV